MTGPAAWRRLVEARTRLVPACVRAFGSGVLLRDFAARWRGAGRGLAVVYHNVAAPPADNRLNMAVGPGQFAAQVAQWHRAFRLTGDIPGVRHGRAELLLTFDDAYAGVARHALPVLRAYGLPAVIFVAPWFIGRRDGFWWDALYDWLVRLPHDGAVREIAGERFTAAAGFAASAVFDRLLPRLWAEHPARLAELLAAAGVPLLPAADDWRPLTWDEVRACAAAGVRIGCHGHTHRMFAALPAAELQADLAAAEAAFIRELGEKPGLLAVPYGAPGSWNEITERVARERGYRAVFLNTGSGRPAGDLFFDRVSVRNTPYVHPKTYGGLQL